MRGFPYIGDTIMIIVCRRGPRLKLRKTSNVFLRIDDALEASLATPRPQRR
jgi:hypothetical protein